jgi:hypothetical protein
VVIDESHPPVAESEGCVALQRSRAATVVLGEIDAARDGRSDAGLDSYAGPLVADLDFGAFSHSALVRMADEVCLQMHLLVLGFHRAVERRSEPDVARRLATRQLIGIAGVAAERIHHALDLPADEAGALRTLALHPLLNPEEYVDAAVSDRLDVRPSSAHEDGAWISLCGPGSPEPLQAAVRAIDPHLDVEIEGSDEEWTATVVRREQPAPVAEEVAVTRISTGAAFVFEARRSLPITPVQR